MTRRRCEGWKIKGLHSAEAVPIITEYYSIVVTYNHIPIREYRQGGRAAPPSIYDRGEQPADGR